MVGNDYNQAKDIFVKAAKALPEHSDEFHELMLLAIDCMQDGEDVEIELRDLEASYKEIFERVGVSWPNKN